MANANVLEYVYAAEVRRLALSLQRAAAGDPGEPALQAFALRHPLRDYVLQAHHELQAIASMLRHEAEPHEAHQAPP